MILKYNGLGLHGVATPTEQMVLLIPGVNELSQEKWEMIKNHPTVKEMIEDQKIEVISEDEKPVDKVFTKMGKKEAIATVNNTIDVAILEKWAENEKRADVLKAIRARIELLIAPPEFRDQKKES